MMNSREACARRLDELAADERFEGRGEDLRLLAAAVRDQGDGSWTGIDLIGAFPAEASITVSKMHVAERVLGAMAGISVFLPVAWTWLGLHSASRAYESLLASGDEGGRTFLSLWTTGFDGRLNSLHHLVPMAMIAFGLVMLAVLAIVGHRLVAERNVAHEEESAREARRDLAGTLGAAQRFLNERRTDDPRFLEEALKRSVGELNRAHEASQQGVEALRQATHEAAASLTASSTAAATAMADTTKAAADAMATSTQRAADALAASTQKAVEGLGAVSEQIVRQLQPILESTSEAGSQMATAALATTTAQEKLNTATTELQEALARTLESFQETVVQSNAQLTQQTAATLAEFSSGVAGVANAKHEWAEVLRGGLDANRDSVDHVAAGNQQFAALLQQHGGIMQSQISELTRTADLTGQLLAELRGRDDMHQPEANGHQPVAAAPQPMDVGFLDEPSHHESGQ